MYGRKYSHYVKGLDPIADAFAGTVYSDIVSMQGHDVVTFVLYKGVGTTGTSTLTVEACSTVGAAATSAIPFRYQRVNPGDTHGAETLATVSGFTTTAGSSELYIITAKAEDLAASGYEFVRLKAVEVANDPVLGGILVIMQEPKDDKAVQATVIV